MGRKESNAIENREWNYLMLNPHLYKSGINGECFSQKMFAGYLAYGLWYALTIYMTTYVVECQLGEKLSDGKDIGLWVAGDNVYGICIIVANIVLFHRLHNIDKYAIGLYAFSIACYFLALAM